MPIVKKRIERLFPEEQFFESQTSLLNTIRVPKNLLYLTDRLPKPNYTQEEQKRRQEEEEKFRRKTHDAGAMLPDIKNQKKSQLPPKKTNIKKQLPLKQSLSKVQLHSTNNVHEQIGEGSINVTGNRGSSVANNDDDRRSVISKSSKAPSLLKNQASHDMKVDDNSSVATSQMKPLTNSPYVARKNNKSHSNKKQMDLEERS